jgi:hypothetical protein
MQPGTAHASQADSGSRRRGVYGLEPQVILADDVVQVDALVGATIDRTEHGMPLSVQFCFPVRMPLLSGEQATFAIEVQDANTSDPLDPTVNSPGSFADYGAQPDPVIIQGNDDDSPVETTVRVNVDISGARRFVRANPTVTLPSGVDAAIAGVVIVGGTEFLPL